MADLGVVNTVLGQVPANELGVVATHEALLSVFPGAQFAPDILIDRADVFDVLAGKLAAFAAAGGRTIVESTGMFHGRDLPLYEALSKATGVHIVASTGLGPEELLGGYFLTPQTDPPTPWPADKFADLFAREVTEGMVVPRVERRRAAGLVTTTVTRTGATATDVSLLRGAARAAVDTGVAASIRFGADAVGELEIVLAEGLRPERVLVGGLDRQDAVAAGWAHDIAARGAFVGIDHVGQSGAGLLDDPARAALLADLVRAGHAHRLVLSSNAIGVAKGLDPVDVPFEHVLTAFVPLLESGGIPRDVIMRMLVENPRALLAVQASRKA